MKAVINGYTVECTIEEFRELLKLEAPEKRVEVEVKPVIYRRRKNSKRKWTSEEISYVRSNMHKSDRIIARELHRTESAVGNKKCELRRSTEGAKAPSPSKPMLRRNPVTPNDKRLERAPTSFPDFTTVKTERLDLLISVIKHMIQSRSEMRYTKDAYVLGLDGISEWAEFTREFITNSPAIARYFGIKNNFKLSNGVITIG